MFRAVNDYMAKLNIVTDEELIEKVRDYLSKSKKINSFTINVNYNRYIVDIRLKKYSVSSADSLFRDFVACVSYSYSHITVRYNEDNRVIYRYATCKEDKNGVYMDLIIS